MLQAHTKQLISAAFLLTIRRNDEKTETEISVCRLVDWTNQNESDDRSFLVLKLQFLTQVDEIENKQGENQYGVHAHFCFWITTTMRHYTVRTIPKKTIDYNRSAKCKWREKNIKLNWNLRFLFECQHRKVTTTLLSIRYDFLIDKKQLNATGEQHFGCIFDWCDRQCLHRFSSHQLDEYMQFCFRCSLLFVCTITCPRLSLILIVALSFNSNSLIKCDKARFGSASKRNRFPSFSLLIAIESTGSLKSIFINEREFSNKNRRSMAFLLIKYIYSQVNFSRQIEIECDSQKEKRRWKKVETSFNGGALSSDDRRSHLKISTTKFYSFEFLHRNIFRQFSHRINVMRDRLTQQMMNFQKYFANNFLLVESSSFAWKKNWFSLSTLCTHDELQSPNVKNEYTQPRLRSPLVVYLVLRLCFEIFHNSFRLHCSLVAPLRLFSQSSLSVFRFLLVFRFRKLNSTHSDFINFTMHLKQSTFLNANKCETNVFHDENEYRARFRQEITRFSLRSCMKLHFHFHLRKLIMTLFFQAIFRHEWNLHCNESSLDSLTKLSGERNITGSKIPWIFNFDSSRKFTVPCIIFQGETSLNRIRNKISHFVYPVHRISNRIAHLIVRTFDSLVSFRIHEVNVEEHTCWRRKKQHFELRICTIFAK